MTAKVIVADAGPLIALAKLQKLGLLSDLFSEVFVPETVCAEVTVNPIHSEQAQLNAFLSDSITRQTDLDNELTKLLRHSFDEGVI